MEEIICHKQHRKGHWSEEKVLAELKAVISKIGHFPTPNELKLMNRQDLIYGISINKGTAHFRILSGVGLYQKPDGYWTEENTIKELNVIIEAIGDFPTHDELANMGRNDLDGGIKTNGGFNKFRKLLGYEPPYKPKGYWTEKTIYNELELILTRIGYYPKRTDLELLGKTDLICAIRKHGGLQKLKKLMGYDICWDDDKIIKELKNIINTIGHFPSEEEIKRKKRGLQSAIRHNGGLSKFREAMHYNGSRKPSGFWTSEVICAEISQLIKKLGHYPSMEEIKQQSGLKLMAAITRTGGINFYRETMGYDYLRVPNGYWTIDSIVSELKDIINTLNHCPSYSELESLGRHDLMGAIDERGGLLKFQNLCGYSQTARDKYRSELCSYINKRGRSSESIVRKILIDFCRESNLQLQCNKKLNEGNVIEFVCNTSRAIGIDVTNTKVKKSIRNKWVNKSYCKYLDELWIVVFSNAFRDQDYIKWNQESPNNIKIMSIYQFIEELDYSLDEHTKNKIDKYNSCTFHTKEELKGRKEFIQQSLFRIARIQRTLTIHTSPAPPLALQPSAP